MDSPRTELTIVWMHGDPTRVKSFTWLYNLNINKFTKDGQVSTRKTTKHPTVRCQALTQAVEIIVSWSRSCTSNNFRQTMYCSNAPYKSRRWKYYTRRQLFRSRPSNTRKTCWLLHQVPTMQQRWRTVPNKQAATVSTPDLRIKQSAYVRSRTSSNKTNYSPV
jgi:hypothetical protein